MSSELQIYNRALDAIGARNDVNSTLEESREAEVCRLWFGQVRDQVLRAAHWGSARAFSRLALLKERDENVAWADNDPEPGYAYAHAVPSDMLIPRYLSTFERFSMGLYESGGTDQLAVMSQNSAPVLVYTKRQTITGLWDIGLDMSITYALAASICMPLTGKNNRARALTQQANDLILEARLQDANQNQVSYDTIPEWISARGYAYGGPSQRFLYPYGPMISLTELGVVA